MAALGSALNFASSDLVSVPRARKNCKAPIYRGSPVDRGFAAAKVFSCWCSHFVWHTCISGNRRLSFSDLVYAFVLVLRGEGVRDEKVFPECICMQIHASRSQRASVQFPIWTNTHPHKLHVHAVQFALPTSSWVRCVMLTLEIHSGEPNH